jgi:tRNA (cytidine/uridine-2'-O-)-methyltransferase
MSFNIVLIEPEIPNNTGNIGRLSLASGCQLHLVKPFGFELSDKRVKRAGLDYWKHVDLHIYEHIDDFFDQHQDKKFAFFSSKAEKHHWDLKFQKDLFLVFGKESVGLPDELVHDNDENTYKIPIHSPHIRSLNLANAVGIIVYHGLFQLR